MWGLFGLKAGVWFYVLLVVLSVGYVAGSVLEIRFHNFLTRLFYTASAMWLGVGLLFIFVLVVFEVVWIFWKPAGMAGGWVVLGVVGVLSIYSIINAQILRVKEVKIAAGPEMKIVQLSDIHIGSVGESFLRRVVEKTNSLGADVVLVTGDLIEPHGLLEKGTLSALDEIRAPVFFVTGNHERYADLDRVGEVLKETKVRWLRNEAVDFGDLQIIGIDDSESKSRVEKELEGIKVSGDKFSVLMYHRPDGFEAAAKKGVDLMVAGHTHNGQIFPFNYIVRLYFSRLKGLFEHDGSYLYVCPGTGTWGPRMKLGSASEIVLIKLGSKEQ
jgi:predicted MPP superfamily phosphohydrolase